MQGLTRNQIWGAAAMIVAAGVLVLLHLFATGLSCAWDTSYCARSAEKNGVYEGTLYTMDGRPYRSAPFEVAFESRRDREKVPFRTDASGGFCIRWASEPSYPSPTSPSGEPLLTGREGGAPLPGLTDWRDLEGGEPPPGCQDSFAGIPWNEARDAQRTWQFWLLVLLPLGAAAFLILALGRWRTEPAVGLFGAGVALLLADLIAAAILWGPLMLG